MPEHVHGVDGRVGAPRFENSAEVGVATCWLSPAGRCGLIATAGRRPAHSRPADGHACSAQAQGSFWPSRSSLPGGPGRSHRESSSAIHCMSMCLMALVVAPRSTTCCRPALPSSTPRGVLDLGLLRNPSLVFALVGAVPPGGFRCQQVVDGRRLPFDDPAGAGLLGAVLAHPKIKPRAVRQADRPYLGPWPARKADLPADSRSRSRIAAAVATSSTRGMSRA